MTSSNQPRSTPQFVLLVFGKPTSADLPQASWYRVEDRATVIAAAQSLKLSVLDIQADGDRALLEGVHEGVLKGAGRIIVGSVTPDVYKRIEEYAAKATGALAVKGSNDVAAVSKVASEQSTNASSTGKPEKSATATNPWETLRVGSRVLAAYWDEAQEFAGFYLATVKRIDSGEFTVEWLDSPDYPPFKVPPKNLAVPHPEFRHLRR